MSEMVERVARAMAHTVQPDWDEGLCWETRPDTPSLGEPTSKAEYRDMARAALEAMREPTDDMLLVIWEKQQGHDFTPDEDGASEWYGDLRDLRAGYDAMIDAALTKKSPD